MWCSLSISFCITESVPRYLGNPPVGIRDIKGLRLEALLLLMSHTTCRRAGPKRLHLDKVLAAVVRPLPCRLMWIRSNVQLNVAYRVERKRLPVRVTHAYNLSGLF